MSFSVDAKTTKHNTGFCRKDLMMIGTENHGVKRTSGMPPLTPYGRFSNAPSEIEMRLARLAVEKKKVAVATYRARIRELAASDAALDDDGAVAVGELAAAAGIAVDLIEPHIKAIREITEHEAKLSAARARDLEPIRAAAAAACASARIKLLDIAREMFDDSSANEPTIAENIVRAATTLPRRPSIDVGPIVTAVREATASVENATFAPEMFRQSIRNVRSRHPELFGD